MEKTHSFNLIFHESKNFRTLMWRPCLNSVNRLIPDSSCLPHSPELAASHILAVPEPHLYWDILKYAHILVKIKHSQKMCQTTFMSTTTKINQLHACHSIFNLIFFHMPLSFLDVSKSKQNESLFYYMHLIKNITIITE